MRIQRRSLVHHPRRGDEPDPRHPGLTLRWCFHPDVLLVDIRLGEFNGLQLVATSPQSAAVVMTGHDDVDLERQARRMGADYLVKPVPPAVLLETIERHVPARSCDS